MENGSLYHLNTNMMKQPCVFIFSLFYSCLLLNAFELIMLDFFHNMGFWFLDFLISKNKNYFFIIFKKEN